MYSFIQVKVKKCIDLIHSMVKKCIKSIPKLGCFNKDTL